MNRVDHLTIQSCRRSDDAGTTASAAVSIVDPNPELEAQITALRCKLKQAKLEATVCHRDLEQAKQELENAQRELQPFGDALEGTEDRLRHRTALLGALVQENPGGRVRIADGAVAPSSMAAAS